MSVCCCPKNITFDLSGMVVDPNDEEKVIPDIFKTEVVKKILLPYYKENIEYIVNTKSGWSRVSTVFMTASTLLVGAASILSFASGVYPNRDLNFVAGSIGLVALVFKEFASYANTIDHVKTLSINDILKNLNIEHEMSDISKNNERIFNKDKILAKDDDTDVGSQHTRRSFNKGNMSNMIFNLGDNTSLDNTDINDEIV
jgi:hypothetical protein|tara:strand:- start:177 stop:776 length:600 start_codon:yes stop_codon:yes gene_type:complete